jgi:hypothetical protein
MTTDMTPPPSEEKLGDAERKLLAAVTTGTLVDLRAGDAEVDDPARAADWGDDRTVRAELLAELLTGERTPPGGRLRAVKLRGARITGPFDMEARTLACPLLLHDCRIEQDVNLSEATAPVIRLTGCHLPALIARQLRTTGDVKLDHGFTAHGEVGLPGAHIGGQLDLSGASLQNEEGPALNADGLTVDQDLFCREGFKARGEVGLLGAHIGGQLDLSGASLQNEEGPALNADQLTVDQGMFCREGFKARGEVRLLGAHIGGQLDLSGASLQNEKGPALNAYTLTVDQGMFCGKGFTADGEVKLISAKVGSFVDDQASWPARLRLRGFVYDSLENEQVSTRARLRWLQLDQGGFSPQVYDQLAVTYRRAGDDTAARKVAIAKQWRRRRKFNPLNWLWYATVGYGYRTWLAGIWLVALVGLGTWVFSGAYPAHHVTAIRTNPPPFHASVYALDILLPVIGLGQKAAWQPKGSAYLYWTWALTVTGWVLATAVAAGLTGILKRD